MTINTNTLVSITEANQNFSKVARLVDQNVKLLLKKSMIIISSIPMTSHL